MKTYTKSAVTNFTVYNFNSDVKKHLTSLAPTGGNLSMVQ